MESQSVPVRNVDEAEFERLVVERSNELPVVVDFWAEWCGPCRALGPALERAVTERSGQVELAKVDVDRNQALGARFGVQGIPAVKAFRDGSVISEFTGAIPPAQIATFLDSLIPNESELAAEAALNSGDEDELRRALQSDPRNLKVATALARALLDREDSEGALEIAGPLTAADFELAGIAAQARLALSEDPPAEALAVLRAGDHERALELLLTEISSSNGERRDQIRQIMVGLFSLLGPESELATSYRRRLAQTLS